MMDCRGGARRRLQQARCRSRLIQVGVAVDCGRGGGRVQGFYIQDAAVVAILVVLVEVGDRKRACCLNHGPHLLHLKLGLLSIDVTPHEMVVALEPLHWLRRVMLGRSSSNAMGPQGPVTTPLIQATTSPT